MFVHLLQNTFKQTEWQQNKYIYLLVDYFIFNDFATNIWSIILHGTYHELV